MRLTPVRHVIVTSIAILSLLAIGVAPAAARGSHSRHHGHSARACRNASHRHARRRSACAASHRRNHRRHHHAAKHNHRTAQNHGRSTHALGTSTAAPSSPVGTPSTSSNPAPPVARRPIASTAPCANTDLTPDPTNIAVVEAATLCLVNQVRGQHGLAALAPNADLQQSAEQHNNDMVAKDYFAHNGPAGDTPLSRIQATGYLADDSVSWVVGENIAWGTLSLSTPAAIVQAWVNSPEHLANILDGDYTDSGLAVAPQAPPSLAQGQQGAIYTQDFGGVDTSGD